MTLSCWITWAALGICIAGFVVLMRSVTYPAVDSCSLLALSQAMYSPVRLNRYFLVVFNTGPYQYYHKKNVVFYSYNLTLNLLRLFAPEKRFRSGQWLNLGLYALFILTFFFFFRAALGRFGLESPSVMALLLVLFLAAQCKLMATTVFIYSEIMNYFLFGLVALLVLQMETSASAVAAFALGGVTGLCLRNRQQDIVLIPAGLIFLFCLESRWESIAFFSAGFVALTVDLFYLQFVKKEPVFECLTSILQFNAPAVNEAGPKNGLAASIRDGVRQMLDIRGGRSLYASAGITFFLFPFSLSLMVFAGHFPLVAGYLVVCWLGFSAPMLLVRNNSGSSAFFHARQAYILMILMHGVNGIALGLSLSRGWDSVSYAYLAAFGANLAHQAYKVVRYHFSDTVHEAGLRTHPKQPPAYSVVLRDYLLTLPRPVVVMGSHMAWGEIYGFFDWSEDFRAVDLEIKVDDATLMELIDRYGVTHLALTPMSWYPIPGETTVRTTLGPLLRDRLVPHVVSDDVTVFEVTGRDRKPAKEAI